MQFLKKIYIYSFLIILIVSIPISNSNSSILNKNISTTNIDRYIADLKNNDLKIRKDAEKQLLLGGETAVSNLGVALIGEDEAIACASATILGEMDISGAKELISFLNDVINNNRYYYINSPRIQSAYSALENIGPQVIPLLLDAILKSKEDFYPWFWEIHALFKKFGKAGTHYFESYLKSEKLDLKLLIILVLRDTKDSNGIPYLSILLEDTHPCIRSAAVIAIGKLGKIAEPLSAKIESFLKDDEIIYKFPDDVLKHFDIRNERATSIQALKQISNTNEIHLSDIEVYLFDKDIYVRIEAIKLLGKIRNDQNEEYVKKLLFEKQFDNNAEVRAEAIKETNKLNKSIDTFDVLVNALDDISSLVRKEALVSLRNCKNHENEVFDISLNLLDDRSPTVRSQALNVLSKFKDKSKEIIQVIVPILDEPNDIVRLESVKLISTFSENAEVLVPNLILLMHDNNSDVRSASIDAISRIGPAAKIAINELVEIAKNPNDPDWEKAINALQKIGPASFFALKALSYNKNEETRKKSITAIGNVVPISYEASNILLDIWRTEKEQEVRQAVAISMGKIGTKIDDVIPELCDALKKKKGKDLKSAIQAVRNIGNKAECSIDILISILDDSDIENKKEAIRALGKFGVSAADAVEPLLRIINEDDKDLLNEAVQTIGNIGPAAFSAVETLTKIIENESYTNKENVIKSLGRIGHNAVGAIPVLISNLDSSDPGLRIISTDALINITLDILYNPKKEYLKNISKIEEKFSKIPELRSEKYEQKEQILNIVRKTIQEIKRTDHQRFYNRIYEFYCNNILLILFIGAYFCINLIFIILYCVWPRSILSIHNSFISRMKVPIGNISFLPEHIRLDKAFITGKLITSKRVLDQWILSKLENALNYFSSKPTVIARKLFIDMPLLINNELSPCLSIQQMRNLFKEELVCILINGEGGVGKTSLACKIASVCMVRSKKENLFGHPCIPIFIEDEINIEGADKNIALIEYIRKQLQITVGDQTEIQEKFLTNLLRKQRVLVIVDHFSEMSKSTRALIQFDSPAFPVNALIITSRIDESTGGYIPKILTPLKIQGGDLYPFFDPYLRKKDKRSLFNDKAIGLECEHLSDIVGDRSITILMCKLYVDQIISYAEKRLTSLPENLPALMLTYLNELNANISVEEKKDDTLIHEVAKKIAWVCLRENFIPSIASKNDIKNLIEDDNDFQILDYLENRLKIISTIDPEKTHIKFELDPLSEYLASLYIVENLKNNRELWDEHLKKIDGLVEKDIPVEGFIHSLYDCCKVYQNKLNIPTEAINRLMDKVLK